MFTVKSLIKYLLLVEDQDLPVKVCIDDKKYNKIKPEVNNTGYRGWTQGELRLVGKPDSWKSRKEKEWDADPGGPEAPGSKQQAPSVKLDSPSRR